MSTVDAGSAVMVKWRKGDVSHMKRFLCLLLLLLLLPAAALADSPADPVLMPIAPETLPQGRYYHLGGSRILVHSDGDDPLLIYDLDTGESIVVKPREEDLDLWVAYYVASLSAEGEIFTAEDIEQLRNQPLNKLMDFLLAYVCIPQPYSISVEYAALYEGFLLNRHTGVITFIPEGLFANEFTSWNTFLSTNEAHTACLQYDLNGQLLNTASFEGNDHQLWGVVPLKDGALAMLYLTDKENQKTHYQFVLLDKELHVQQVIDAGSHHNQWLDLYAAHLYEENGRLLLSARGIAFSTNSKAMENGKIVIKKVPNGPYLDGLLLIDTETSEVHSLDVATSFLASSDGSYVLLPAPSEERLLRLDMKTGLITEQMSTSEVRSTFKPYLDWYERNGLSVGVPIYSLSWDGGEYAVTPWMVFRVVERSSNP